MARALARFFSAPLGAGADTGADGATQTLANMFANATEASAAWDTAGGASSNVLLQPSRAKLAVTTSNEDSQAGSLAALPLIVLDPGESIISAKSVTIDAVKAAFSEPSEGGSKAWEHALAEARTLHPGCSAAAVAAYVSVHQWPSGIREYLQMKKGAFWVKEFPGALGGDILGFFPGRTPTEAPIGTARSMHVLRAHVKTGTQVTLAQGRGCSASNEATNATLKNICRKNSVLSSTTAAIEANNETVALAVKGCLVAAAMGPRQHHQPVSGHFRTWASNFDRACQLFDVQVACALTTTHALSRAKRRQMTGRGLCVLDAGDLQHSWGAVGILGAQHGILPFAAPPAMDEPAGAAAGDEHDGVWHSQVEELSSLFDTPEDS